MKTARKTTAKKSRLESMVIVLRFLGLVNLKVRIDLWDFELLYLGITEGFLKKERERV